MFKGLNKDGIDVDIDDAIKGEEYFCPCCKGNLIVKKGQINVHHFAHVSNKDCDHWAEMSEWHKEWQSLFPIEYREVSLGEHRADVKFKDLIIEFQKSPLSYEKWVERIEFYKKLGHLFFVVDLRDKAININCNEFKDYIKLDIAFSWEHPSRSIPMPNDYSLFFQLEEEKIAWIKPKTNEDWSYFCVYTVFTKDEFLEFLRCILKGGDEKQLALNSKYAQENLLYIFYRELFALNEELEEDLIPLTEPYIEKSYKEELLVLEQEYRNYREKYWSLFICDKPSKEELREWAKKFSDKSIKNKMDYENKKTSLKDNIKITRESYREKMFKYFTYAKKYINKIQHMSDDELISFSKESLKKYITTRGVNVDFEIFNDNLYCTLGEKKEKNIE